MNKIVTVNFHGTELYGFQLGEGMYVALKPIVEAMGLSWSGQYERVKRSSILSEGIRVIRIPFGRGGAQDMVCLALNFLHGWLFTIETMRVKKDLRPQVELFQRECYNVLYRHFSGDRDKLLQEQHDRRSIALRTVDECRLIFGDRAAAQMWYSEGLPRVPAM